MEDQAKVIIDVMIVGAIATGVAMAGLYLFGQGLRKIGRILIFGAPVGLTIFFLVHLHK